MSVAGTAVSHSPSTFRPGAVGSGAPGSIQTAHSGLSGTGSKRTTLELPPIVTPSPQPRPNSGEKERAEGPGAGKNPFVMPPESEIFTLRERERRKMREERARERGLQVHEKSTYASRLNAKTSSLRKSVLTHELPIGTASADRKAQVHEDTQFVLATTRDRCIEKEDLASYVSRKREMFLVEYALGVKRDEIRKLEEIAKTEEQKLEAAEKYLEESATMFDEFLKENDKSAVEAIKQAEAAAKSKLEKVQEIKRINAQLMTIKNEISRNIEQLTELRTYRQFLNAIAPQEWREQRDAARKIKKSKKKSSVDKLKLEAAADASTPGSVPGLQRQRSGRSARPSVRGEGGEEKVREKPAEKTGQEDLSSDEEEVELYFTAPQQLISMFTELEEQNLSLIMNSQETEETLEDMRQSRKATEQKLNRETESLRKQVDQLKVAIAKEEEKANELEIRSKLYSYGEYKAEDQEQMLAALDKKVADVYSKCIGANEANIPPLQMLTAIEGKLEELFDTIENLPADKVEAAERAKEKERRLRMREEKLAEQRQHQEERLRKALERAQAAPTKKMGRRLVYRSEPPVLKRKHRESQEKRDKEEEELQYFFS